MSSEPITPREAKILAEADKIRARLRAVADRSAAHVARKLVGKCFRYRNSYGCECPGWWLYIRVDRCDKRGSLHGIKFEQTARGAIEYMQDDYLISLSPGSGYTEITEGQFTEAFLAMKAAVTLKPAARKGEKL